MQTYNNEMEKRGFPRRAAVGTAASVTASGTVSETTTTALYVAGSTPKSSLSPLVRAGWLEGNVTSLQVMDDATAQRRAAALAADWSPPAPQPKHSRLAKGMSGLRAVAVGMSCARHLGFDGVGGGTILASNLPQFADVFMIAV